jgi:hypothetical protein
MMVHARGPSRGQQVVRRGPEEVHHRRVIHDGRIRHVHDDLSAVERLGEAIAGERVHARVERRGERIMARFSKLLDELRPNQPGSPDGDDFHRVSSRTSA